VVNALHLAAAVGIGACLSLQPPINAAMARTLGSALLASCVSIAISLVFVVFVWLTWGNGDGDWTQARALPWWVVLGGMIGVVFVAGSVIVTPVVGVALFFACVVAGQLVGSTIADHFGAFGVPPRPIDWVKLFGLALVLAGAALVQRSR
jgi:transporter family-2 protein